MIGAPPSPPLNAGFIIDTYDLVFGDKLILTSVSLPPAIIKFPSHTRVSLRRKKVMSSTNVNGREGSIKEISGIGDWEIDIEAEFVAVEYDLSPLSLLSKMKQALAVFSEQGKVKITNNRMNRAGIESMVIEEIDLPDNTYHSQVVRIRGLSDYDYNLEFFQEPDAYSQEAASTGPMMA